MVLVDSLLLPTVNGYEHTPSLIKQMKAMQKLNHVLLSMRKMDCKHLTFEMLNYVNVHLNVLYRQSQDIYTIQVAEMWPIFWFSQPHLNA